MKCARFLSAPVTKDPTMDLLRSLLYITAIALLAIGALPIRTRVSLPLIGAACALTAYALPTITAAA